MRPEAGVEAPAIRRRAVVVATSAGHVDLRWTEAQCRGCVGCGGRCGLFASDDAGAIRLDHGGDGLSAGDRVDVEVAAPRLRRAASLAYGLAIVALVLGAALGHAVGARWSSENAGAFVGLLLGTFLAGALTKRRDAAPPLRVVHCLESPTETDIDSKELPR